MISRSSSFRKLRRSVSAKISRTTSTSSDDDSLHGDPKKEKKEQQKRRPPLRPSRSLRGSLGRAGSFLFSHREQAVVDAERSEESSFCDASQSDSASDSCPSTPHRRRPPRRTPTYSTSCSPQTRKSKSVQFQDHVGQYDIESLGSFTDQEKEAYWFDKDELSRIKAGRNVAKRMLAFGTPFPEEREFVCGLETMEDTELRECAAGLCKELVELGMEDKLNHYRVLSRASLARALHRASNLETHIQPYLDKERTWQTTTIRQRSLQTKESSSSSLAPSLMDKKFQRTRSTSRLTATGSVVSSSVESGLPIHHESRSIPTRHKSLFSKPFTREPVSSNASLIRSRAVLLRKSKSVSSLLGGGGARQAIPLY